MQPNYWKFGVILLSLIFLCGVLFFLKDNLGKERSVSNNSFQTEPSVGNTEINGEVFLVTQGSGNVKIGLAEIIIENQETKQTFKTTTNADGKFSIVVPSGSYLLNANSTRIYQLRLSGESNKKEMLDKSSLDNSLSEKYKLYYTAIVMKQISKTGEFSKSGNPSPELLARNFVQISEYYNWRLPIKLNQLKQSLQLSNNNLTDFGLKD